MKNVALNYVNIIEFSVIYNNSIWCEYIENLENLATTSCVTKIMYLFWKM